MGHWQENLGVMPCSGANFIIIEARDKSTATGRAVEFDWTQHGLNSDIVRWKRIR